MQKRAKSYRIALRLTKEDYDFVTECATDYDVNLSEVIRRAIQSYKKNRPSICMLSFEEM